jgi:crossover junction endodeoxyribonuclease RuvC
VGNENPIVLGLDPGFAATGYCLLQRAGEYVLPLTMGVIETTKQSKKQIRDLRVTADDYRRVREIYFELQRLMHDFKPVAIAYEVYQPFTGAQLRAATWKVARVEGLIVSIGLQHQALVLPYLTLDLKKGIAVQKSASKAQIEQAMVDLVPDLKAKFEQIPKTKREHVADASGYAFLAFEELDKMAEWLGV